MESADRDVEVGTEQIENLVRDLTKAVRAHHLYRKGNPSYRRFLSELRNAFASVWEGGLEQLELLVTEDRLVWSGATVYEASDRAESFAFLLHKDGVRGLRFLRGFEADDLEAFLETLEQVRYAAREGDDLITLLWERNLPGLHYSAAELVTRGVEIPEPPDGTAFDLLEVRRLALEEEREGDVVGIGGGGEERDTVSDLEWAEAGKASSEMHPTLHVLQEMERVELERELELERERPLRVHVEAALLDSLEVETGEERDHTLRCLAALLDDFVAASDLEGALGLLAEASGAMEGDEAAGVEVLVSPMSSAEAVGQLVGLLTEGKPAGRELFRRFVPYLRGPALAPLYRHAVERADDAVGEELRAAVTSVASVDPDAVPAVLASSDPAVLAAVATTMAEMEIGGSATRLASLLDHPSQTVRLSAVRALSSDPEGGPHLERALEDADSEVRMAAAEGTVRRAYRPAAATLERAVRDRSFETRGLTEMRAFLGAFATLAGDGAVAFLGELLNARGLLGGTRPSDLRACAARALAMVGTEAARRELSRAVDDKDTLVRHAVEQALRGERRP